MSELKLVPIEPTTEMLTAGAYAVDLHSHSPRAVWAAMVKSAPAAQRTDAVTSGDGLIEQHHRDSAELRRLCEARDEARRTAEHWKAEHLAGNAEIVRLTAELEAAKRDIDRYLQIASKSALDAARYQMIRNRSPYWMQHGRQSTMVGKWENDLDATIDAALSASSDGAKGDQS